MPRARILIADDYRTGREALAALLGEEGYSVKTTRQSDVVTERNLDFAPDILMLALGRYVRTGLQLIAQGRAISPQTMVIALGSSKDIDLARASLEAGAVAYLPKPLHFASLLVALKPLLMACTRRSH